MLVKETDVFSPLFELFQRARLLGQGNDSIDASNHMIDGRTIHFHYQYVYPELTAHDDASNGRSAHYPFLNACNFITSNSYIRGVSETVQFVFQYELSFLLFAQNPEELNSLKLNIHSALSDINNASMLWFMALSVGCFTTTDLKIPNSVVIDLITNHQEDLGEKLLACAAENLRQLWLYAEKKTQNRFSSNLATPFDNHFVDSVVNIFKLRSGGHNSRDTCSNSFDLDEYVKKLDTNYKYFPLTKHLLCLWSLGWRRSVFLEGSPYDFARDLADLYQLDNSTTKTWIG